MLPLLVSLCQAWNQPLALTSLHQPARNKVSRGLLFQLFMRISGMCKNPLHKPYLDLGLISRCILSSVYARGLSSCWCEEV